MQLSKITLLISISIFGYIPLKTMENDLLIGKRVFEQEVSSCKCFDLFKHPFSCIYTLLRCQQKKTNKHQKMIQADNKITIETLQKFIDINDALILNNQVSVLTIITINNTREAIIELIENIENEESGLGIYETMKFIIDANTSHIEWLKQLDPRIPQDYITQLEQCSTTLAQIKRNKKYLTSDD